VFFLQQQGFGQVINLRAGIIDWFRQGYSIEASGEVSGLARMAG